jgi:hypothetical protein
MAYIFNTKSVKNLMCINWQRIPLLASDYMNGHSLAGHFIMLYQQKKGTQNEAICVE